MEQCLYKMLFKSVSSFRAFEGKFNTVISLCYLLSNLEFFLKKNSLPSLTCVRVVTWRHAMRARRPHGCRYWLSLLGATPTANNPQFIFHVQPTPSAQARGRYVWADDILEPGYNPEISRMSPPTIYTQYRTYFVYTNSALILPQHTLPTTYSCEGASPQDAEEETAFTYVWYSDENMS
jgi:hypothetical protein